MTCFDNTITLRLESVTCAKCGIVFGLQDAFLAMLRETGAGFYCPNGHSLRFGASAVDRLKQELAATKRQSQQYERWYRAEQADHQHTRNRLRAVKGQQDEKAGGAWRMPRLQPILQRPGAPHGRPAPGICSGSPGRPRPMSAS
jgi:hypothetical protein